jgi:hypothetical protein
LTSINILTDKAIKYTSLRKVNFSVFSRLELMHLAAPLKDHHIPLLALMILQVFMVHLALKVLRAPMVLLLVPQRRKEF